MEQWSWSFGTMERSDIGVIIVGLITIAATLFYFIRETDIETRITETSNVLEEVTLGESSLRGG